jgi:NAD-dependent deacetylase
MIFVLTGAGISQESGIATFRGSGGLWGKHRVEDVATPQGFRKNPALVLDFYNQRRRELMSGGVQPNPAHIALKELEDGAQDGIFLVTQNVDDLHERAGSANVVHMHGELGKSRCVECGKVMAQGGDLGVDSVCPECGAKGGLRPHIVWFGEMPLYMEEIHDALGRADVFVAIGTSGVVYPAAGFVRATTAKRRIEVNLEDSEVSECFDERRVGQASAAVPALVRELLGKG